MDVLTANELTAHAPSWDLTKFRQLDSGMGPGSTVVRQPFITGFKKSVGYNLPSLLEIPTISDLGNTLPEALDNIHALLSSGITLYFTTERLSSSDEKFKDLLHTLDLIAESRVKQTSERIQTARTARSKDGDPVSVSSYGYKKSGGRWMADDTEALRVKMAFYLASQCACYMDIRDVLNGMEEKDGTGMSWNQTRLRYLLLNERYKGDMLTNKTWSWVVNGKRVARRNHGDREQFYIEGHHKALVGAETFDLVRTAVLEGWLKSHRKAPEGGEVEKMMRAGNTDPLLECVR